MIILYHNKNKITTIESTLSINFSNEINNNVIDVFLNVAKHHKDEIIVWCHEELKKNLNKEVIRNYFHHNMLMISFSPSDDNFLDKRIGYVEDSPFILINKIVKYPTWQMSGLVGATHSLVINACSKYSNKQDSFDYFLVSIAKRAMSNGLLCYSEPQLLKDKIEFKIPKKNNLIELFIFTRQHYRLRWIFLLFFNILIFEKRIEFLAFFIAFFYKKRKFDPSELNRISAISAKRIIEKGTLDVLIPTIGRKKYLFDVLNNLANQTYLPENVIIIEQNPLENSSTELEFIFNNSWPFKIKHHFTNKIGACNARNIGISLIESEFVFMADDDIVFENDLIEKTFEILKQIGNEVLLVSCHLKNQIVREKPIVQSDTFGAGHAFLKYSTLKEIKFNNSYEFGFGEDADFGMQLRNNGYDILSTSKISIVHLKAPLGGFRVIPKLIWQKEKIIPKPSPTFMLFKLNYSTKEQLRSYKTTLFIKNLKLIFLINPIRYIYIFNEKWNKSIYWANKLIENNEIHSNNLHL